MGHAVRFTNPRLLTILLPATEHSVEPARATHRWVWGFCSRLSGFLIYMKKILLGLAALVVLGGIALVVILTLSLGSIIKKGVEAVAPPITQTTVQLDSASLSFLSGAGALKGFVLGNPEGYKTPQAMRVGQIAVGIEPRSVFSDKIHVQHVKVEGAEITFEGSLGTKNNLTKIMDNVDSTLGADKDKSKPASKEPAADKGKASKAEPGASKKLQVDDFLISGAKVNVSMNILAGKQLSVTIPDIHFTNLGSGPEGITAAELTKKILGEITPAVMKAVEKGVGDLGKVATDALKDAGKDLSKDGVEKAAKGLGDLLKKK